MSEGGLGTLLYAVHVAGPTYAQMQDIRLNNWIAANGRRGPKFDGFNMHPFVEKVEIDEGIVEYYASNVYFYTLDAADKLWNATDIASARAEFDRWLRSSDAALDQPVHRECVMLRCIVEEAKYIEESILRQNPPKKYVEYAPRTDDKIKRNIADRQLAFDAAVDILVEATLGGKSIPNSSEIAEQVIQKGLLDISHKTFRNILSANVTWGTLMNRAKERPDGDEDSPEYRTWREGFEERLPLLRNAIIQRNDAGIGDEERAVSLKKLAKAAEKKKKTAKRKPPKPKSAVKKSPKRSKRTTPREKKPSE